MPSTIAILGSPTRGTLQLLDGLRRLGRRVELLTPADALARLRASDVALARLDVLPTLDGVEPGLLDLVRLDARGVRVVNRARALVAVHDKLRTVRMLRRARLPHPRTVHVTQPETLLALEPPFVVKPRLGSWGVDVRRLLDRDQVEEWVDELRTRPWFRRHGALVQELLPIVGRDLRVVVAAGRAIGAVERAAPAGEWRTNVSLGASFAPVEPSEEACELAIAAAGATGADLVGVDLHPARGDLVVLELNGAVEFDRTYSLAGRDVYEDLADALRLPPARDPELVENRVGR